VSVASPYPEGKQDTWSGVTDALLNAHPLQLDEIRDVVLACWEDIFNTQIGSYRIGPDIEPEPQIMGFLLYELIPLEFQRRYPGAWRRQQGSMEKDLVCVNDATKSVEIKTSSNASQVFGNRSYAQPSLVSEVGRKGKSGYYLTINFEKFGRADRPALRIIRFGWLDHNDWIAQTAATGQQARIRPEAYAYKLRTLYSK
jgi:ScaI restriction endonuclease